MTRSLSRLGAVLALSIAWLSGAHARTDCPPVPQPPTQEQLAEGFRTAKDRGAMWTLTKDGRTSYLYGTLHVGRMAWAFPGPKLLQALRDTQVLALELDPTDPNLQAEMQAVSAQAGKVTLSPADQSRLDAQADAACVPREALRPMHPVMQLVTYGILSARRDGLDPGFGQEFTLLGFARAQQRAIVSMESMTSQMTVLLPRDAASARASFERLLGDLETGKARTQIVRISEAWASGDMNLLGSLEALCACQPTQEEREFSRLINDDRNPHLARRIAEEHGKGRPVLAAVGILHMTGPKALTTLLAQQGFEVRRVSY
jgi:uncharacterized protein YbaP (TraB family)